jgi:hypothetical protein
LQIDRSGKKITVSKLNDGAVIKVDIPPAGVTYYEVDGRFYVQRYKRIFIKRRQNGSGEEK